MFEAITSKTKVMTPEAVASKAMVERASDTPKPVEDKPQKDLKAVKEKQQDTTRNTEVSQDFLNDLEKDIELIHHVGLQFSVHEDTGRTMVRVVNKDTDELIREIPPEEALNLAAKLEEMIGMVFDKKV